MVKEQFTKGHPIHTYLVETDLILDLVEQIEETNPEHEFQKFYNLFNHLSTVERRFERKENQLFPFLEEKGWTGPSRNMWSFHDTIRDIFRIVRKNIGEKNAAAAWENAKYAGQNLKNLLAVENSVLFPNAMEIFTDEDWIKVRKGEDEIGWMLKESPAPYPNEPQYIHPAEDKVRRTDVVFADDASHFDEGYLTVEQVNLMFKTLPIDLTYVDESDRVIFYNRGDERVFPRSAGIIGREVKFCHPPKSVDTVLKILEAFRKGEQSEASFWFHYKEKLIYVRYFAVRDSDKKYRGVIEMSQDISETKKIEGEKRLLEWK